MGHRLPSASTEPPRTAARRSATGLALRPTRRLPEAAVAQTARAEQRAEVENADAENSQQIQHACLRHDNPPFLEPEILECLSRGAVEVCCKRLIAAPGSEVATGDPRRRAVAGRAELVERGFGRGERVLGLVEPALLEERAAEHELGAADLVDVVLVAGLLEEPQRVARLLLGLLD